MSARNVNRLHQSYTAAWRDRRMSGDNSVGVLFAQFARDGLDEPVQLEPLRDLLADIWERDVPPDRFKLSTAREN